MTEASDEAKPTPAALLIAASEAIDAIVSALEAQSIPIRTLLADDLAARARDILTHPPAAEGAECPHCEASALLNQLERLIRSNEGS